jgi:uncharacterized membrane protein YccC
MTTATIPRPLSLAGAPLSAWAFGVRIWVAVVAALAASFWLELEAPASAAVTVAILAVPTRGGALDKARFRLVATIIGVTAAIVIVALFSQTRDLMLAVFAGWVGLCVCAAGLLDGNRAYAAVLSGYTVALIAIHQLDAPEQVFESGMARGAAIAVGVAAIAVVNDLLAAPDSFPQLASQLAALHRRVRDYAKPVPTDGATDAETAAGLLRDIAALRSEIASLATESASGSIRSAAARSTVVALVAAVHAARALKAIAAATNPPMGEMMAATLQSPALASASGEYLRRISEVHEGLAALNAGHRLHRAWRMPLYRSRAIAAAAGLRAAAYLVLASGFFVLAGWPSAEVSLSLVALVIGLGAASPNPQSFTVAAFIAVPIAAVLAGTLEFLILDGVTEFPLLALALAPFVIGAMVAATRPHPMVASLGRLNLIFILVILSPSNPQSYNANSFLFLVLFLCTGIGLLLAAQTLIPPESIERRQRWIMASVRRDYELVLSKHDRCLAPQEAMFRDATRIAQIPASGASHRDSAILVEALSYFDRAAAIRLGRESVARLAETSLSHLAAEAEEALAAEDTQHLHDIGLNLKDAGGARSALAEEISGELVLAAIAIDAARHAAPPARKRLS